MKTFLILTLLCGTHALAQTAFFPGAKVRMDTVGSEDGLFAVVQLFNYQNVKISLNRISFDQKQKAPQIHSEEMIIPVDRVRALNENDFCFQPGSFARVTNPYLINSNTIGRVIACDGRQVIFESQPNPDPNSIRQQILQMGDLGPANLSSYALRAGDQVTFVAKGYTWTGFFGKVTFTNDQYAWVDYQDASFKSSNVKVRVDDLRLESRIPHTEFEPASLGQNLETLATISHGSRKTFFHEVGMALDRFLPIPQTGISRDSIRFQARTYALLAVRPVIESGTSQIYVQDVNPTYQRTLDQLGLKSLNGFTLSNESSLSATIVLGAVLETAASETTSDAERKILKDFEVKTGLLIAAGAKPSAMIAFIQSSAPLKSIVAKWLQSPNLKPYAITYQSVMNDLEAKLK